MRTDNQVVRAAFEKAYPMPFACGWNSTTHEYEYEYEYECIWPEHAGEEPVEAAIAQHNDRYRVWTTSRETLVVDLPEPEPFNVSAEESLEMDPDEHDYLECRHGAQYSTYRKCRAAIEATGVRVTP